MGGSGAILICSCHGYSLLCNQTPLISNPQRQHPFDNISRCQVFCKNLKLAALPMCWLCLLQISKIWKNTAVCGPLWSAVAAIHRWMVSTNSSAPTDHCAGSGDGCGVLPLQSFPLWYYCHWPWRHEPNQGVLTWTFSFYLFEFFLPPNRNSGSDNSGRLPEMHWYNSNGHEGLL